MGLFDRLFKQDPHQALERAKKLLDRGEATEALRLARRAAEEDPITYRPRAEEVIRRAHEVLADAALDKAARAEESEYFEDAAEWIGTALDHVEDVNRREELEQRVAGLLERAVEAEKARLRKIAPEPELWEEPEDEPEEESEEFAEPELDPEAHYDTLIGMLDDDVAARYEERPESFRRAFLQLHDLRPQEALPVLDQLADKHPDDPVYRLERGRGRLLVGAYEGACDDLEAVWKVFGDEPLDQARTYSVPGLWAEAMFAQGKVAELLERLDEVAVPSECDPGLCYHYASGLVAGERFEEARLYLLEVMRNFPQAPDFPDLLAAVLDRLGQRQAAIDTLERAIAPSCSPGRCRRPPKHVPSLRTLAGLYLAEGRDLRRVHELLSLISQVQGGRLEAGDYQILAGYHQARGDDESARRAAAAARRLEQAASASGAG